MCVVFTFQQNFVLKICSKPFKKNINIAWNLNTFNCRLASKCKCSSGSTQTILGHPGKFIECIRAAASKSVHLKCAFWVSFKFEWIRKGLCATTWQNWECRPWIGEKVEVSQDEGGVTPWTSRQLIAGPNDHPRIHSRALKRFSPKRIWALLSIVHNGWVDHVLANVFHGKGC